MKDFFSHSLRTSETSYLNEAFSFYSAIRQRSYYSQVNKEDRYAPTMFVGREREKTIFSLCGNYAEKHILLINGLYRVPAMY